MNKACILLIEVYNCSYVLFLICSPYFFAEELFLLTCCYFHTYDSVNLVGSLKSVIKSIQSASTVCSTHHALKDIGEHLTQY